LRDAPVRVRTASDPNQYDSKHLSLHIRPVSFFPLRRSVPGRILNLLQHRSRSDAAISSLIKLLRRRTSTSSEASIQIKNGDTTQLQCINGTGSGVRNRFAGIVQSRTTRVHTVRMIGTLADRNSGVCQQQVKVSNSWRAAPCESVSRLVRPGFTGRPHLYDRCRSTGEQGHRINSRQTRCDVGSRLRRHRASTHAGSEPSARVRRSATHAKHDARG
jgi:hypothetical protein